MLFYLLRELRNQRRFLNRQVNNDFLGAKRAVRRLQRRRILKSAVLLGVVVLRAALTLAVVVVLYALLNEALVCAKMVGHHLLNLNKIKINCQWARLAQRNAGRQEEEWREVFLS